MSSPRNDLVKNYRCTRHTGLFPHRPCMITRLLPSAVCCGSARRRRRGVSSSAAACSSRCDFPARARPARTHSSRPPTGLSSCSPGASRTRCCRSRPRRCATRTTCESRSRLTIRDIVISCYLRHRPTHPHLRHLPTEYVTGSPESRRWFKSCAISSTYLAIAAQVIASARELVAGFARNEL